MKKIQYIALCSLLFACNKPDAILFQDNSTAAMADKSSWTATADSETPDGWENTGKASALLDGDKSTYWHTDYSVSPTPGYPHWVLIDMKEDNNLISVAVTNRQGGSPYKNGMKKFKLEGSTDGNTFTSLGEFDFAITNDAQTFPVSSANAYRYLKLTALESQTGAAHTFLSEIDVFVTKNK
jgi:hypothetical protein